MRGFWKHFVLAVLVCIAIGPGSAPAVDWKRLDETTALKIFFERNLDLIASQFQIDRALAVEWMAGALPNPVLSFGLNELNGVLTARPTEVGSQGLGYNFFLTQRLVMAGRRGLRMESARFGREASEADFRDTVRWMVNQVRRALIDLLLAQKTCSVLRENMITFEKITQANRVRERFGDISGTELERIEVERLKSLGELDLATSDLVAKKADFAKLLNWPDASMDLEVESSGAMPPASIEDLKEQDLLDQAYHHRPDLLAQDLRIQQLTKELELARRLVVPDLTVSGGYLQDAGNLQIDTGAIVVSGELPVLYQYEGEVGKAASALDVARSEREMLKNRIRMEISTAMASLRSALRIISRFESTVLPRIGKSRAAIEYSFAQGSSGLIDLLDAERNYKSMMLDYYASEAERSTAYADLRSALGEEGGL